MMKRRRRKRNKRIGKVKIRNLIIKYKNIDNIKSATVDDIAETQSVSYADAENIKKFFDTENK